MNAARIFTESFEPLWIEFGRAVMLIFVRWRVAVVATVLVGLMLPFGGGLPANAQTGVCWQNAGTSQPIPSGNLVPTGATLDPTDPSRASQTVSVTVEAPINQTATRTINYVRDADGSWSNAGTGQPIPSGNLVPTGATLDPTDPDRASQTVSVTVEAPINQTATRTINYVRVPCPPPTKVATGCTGVGMTTSGPGQDAGSKLGPAKLIQGGTSPGFSAEIKTPPGLNTIIFTTERSNRIELYMPNRLFNGKTFSASTKVIFKNPGDQNELTGYSVKIGGQQTALNNGIFSVALPAATAPSTTDLVLVDKKGKQKVGVSLPVYPALPSLPSEFDMPGSGTSGDLIVIQGPIKGAIEPTDYVRIGGQNIQLLAKTESQLVVLNTNDTPGLTEIESNVNGSVAKSQFRNLTLKMWADKYHLLKGEGTTVHMLVSGLEKLETPASMTIQTAGTVEMNGGNSQALSITPEEVKPDGTYSTDRHLSSYAAGDFEVVVIVKATPNCAPAGQPLFPQSIAIKAIL